jgi:hypothetical protein
VWNEIESALEAVGGVGSTEPLSGAAGSAGGGADKR